MPRRRRRSFARGAVFVEALIVLSVFILFFLGIVYFRELYVGKMTTQRLARAGAVAHAMSACKSDLGGLLRADLPKGFELRGGTAKDGSSPFFSASGDFGTDNLFSNVADGFGGTALNEMTTVTVSGTAGAKTRSGPLGKKTGFESTVSSSSYVSCGDQLTTDRYSALPQAVISFLPFDIF